MKENWKTGAKKESEEARKQPNEVINTTKVSCGLSTLSGMNYKNKQQKKSYAQEPDAISSPFCTGCSQK